MPCRKVQRVSLAGWSRAVQMVVIGRRHMRGDTSAEDTLEGPRRFPVLVRYAHEPDSDVSIELDVVVARILVFEETNNSMVVVNDRIAHKHPQRTVADSGVVHQVERAVPGEILHLVAVIVDFIHIHVCGLKIDELVCKHPDFGQSIKMTIVNAVTPIRAVVRMRIEVAGVDASHVVLEDFRVVIIENRWFERVCVPNRRSCCFEESRPGDEQIGVKCEALLLMWLAGANYYIEGVVEREPDRSQFFSHIVECN
jgi:hypothetical protein